MTTPTNTTASRPRPTTRTGRMGRAAARSRMVAVAVLILAWAFVPTIARATPTTLTRDGLSNADVASCVIIGDLSDYTFLTNDSNLFFNRPSEGHIYFSYRPSRGTTSFGASKWFQLDYEGVVLDSTGTYHDLHVRVGNVRVRWGANPDLGVIRQRLVTCYPERLSIDASRDFMTNSSFEPVTLSEANKNIQEGIKADIQVWAGNEQDDAQLTYNLYIADIDIRDHFSNTYEGEWSESIALGSTFDTIHVEPDTLLTMSNYRIYGSANDDNTPRSRFVSLSTMSAAQPMQFTWAASAEAGVSLFVNWSHEIAAKATVGGTVAIGTGSGTMLDTPVESISDGSYRTQTTLEAVPGNDYLVRATPSYGYDIAEMLLDGVSLGATDAVSIPAIAADHTVCAVFVPRRGKIGLEKASSNASITDQSPCYTLSGATYGLYADEGCTDLVATLVTDAHGVTEAIEVPIGTYWLRETTAPAGYALDAHAHEVEVVVGTTTTIPLVDEPLADTPPDGSVLVLAQKVDAQTGAAEGQGSTSLAGTEFAVRFYADWYEEDALPVTPTRRWVLTTDADGRAALDDDHVISGDELYHNGSGQSVLPLGTLVVEETKAPDGYTLPTDVQPVVQHIGVDTDTATVQGIVEPDAAHPTASDEVVRGGLAVKKTDEKGAGLAGASFAVVNRSEHSVVVGNATFAPGERCLTLTSNSEGVAASAPHALPPGTYEVVEQDAPRGYRLDSDWSVAATISIEGNYVDLTDNPLQDARKTIDVELVATKTFDGTSLGLSLEAGQFSFELCNGEGTVLQTKANDADGTVTFDPLTFDYRDLEDIHSYRIREKRGDDADIVYDTHVEEVQIVLREEDGALKANVVTDDDGIAFHNRAVRPVDIPLTGSAGISIGLVGGLLSIAALGLKATRRMGGLRS